MQAYYISLGLPNRSTPDYAHAHTVKQAYSLGFGQIDSLQTMNLNTP